MEQLKKIETKEDAIKLLNAALEHEWAVSFEYTIHAYSMPKGKFFYEDPIMKNQTDVRAQTIQIGIDEMYHALQLGMIVTQMEGIPSFKTDQVIRYPRIMDNLKRDKESSDVNNFKSSKKVELSDIMKFCPSCGEKIKPNNKFCPECGFKLQEFVN